MKVWCSKCQQFKDETEFSKDRASKNGLSGVCKACDSFRAKCNYRQRGSPRRQAGDFVRPLGAVMTESNRQRKVREYGAELVETMDSLTGVGVDRDYYEDILGDAEFRFSHED